MGTPTIDTTTTDTSNRGTTTTDTATIHINTSDIVISEFSSTDIITVNTFTTGIPTKDTTITGMTTTDTSNRDINTTDTTTNILRHFETLFIILILLVLAKYCVLNYVDKNILDIGNNKYFKTMAEYTDRTYGFLMRDFGTINREGMGFRERGWYMLQ